MRSELVCSSRCRPVSKTTRPFECSTRKLGIGIFARPGSLARIDRSSISSQPHTIGVIFTDMFHQPELSYRTVLPHCHRRSFAYAESFGFCLKEDIPTMTGS